MSDNTLEQQLTEIEALNKEDIISKSPFKINRELLALIHSVVVISTEGEELTNEQVNSLPDHAKVYLYLTCTPSDKFKLKEYHYAKTTVKEAKFYISIIEEDL